MKERGGASLCQSQPAWPSPLPVLQVVVTHIKCFGPLKLSIFCLVGNQSIFTCKDVFFTARLGLTARSLTTGGTFCNLCFLPWPERIRRRVPEMVSQLLKSLPGGRGKDILLKRLKKQQNISTNYLKAWAVEKRGTSGSIIGFWTHTRTVGATLLKTLNPFPPLEAIVTMKVKHCSVLCHSDYYAIRHLTFLLRTTR